MNKEDVLKNLFELSQEDIFDIFNIIKGYQTSMKKVKKDTYGIRRIFAKGYHSITEYMEDIGIEKDDIFYQALIGKSVMFKKSIQLIKLLDLDINKIDSEGGCANE